MLTLRRFASVLKYLAVWAGIALICGILGALWPILTSPRPSKDLGLGIGICAAIFSLLDGIVFRQLPYAGADRLVSVWETYPHWRERPVLQEMWDRIGLAWPEYERWRVDQRSFDAVGVYALEEMSLTGAQGAERVGVGLASSSLFPLLSATPAAGRLIGFGEDGTGAARVAVLAHGLWQSRWGADERRCRRL